MNMKYLGVALGILLLSMVAVVVIAHSFTGNSGNKPKTSTAKVLKLLDYENENASLSVTIKGQLVGDDQRKAIRMVITPEDRGIEELDGYSETVVRSKHYPNTQGGYENFLHALNYTGFLQKRTVPITDERGVCPYGNTYNYDMYNGQGQQVFHAWGTSCGIALGTFAGAGPGVRQLFQAQINDYDEFTSDIIIQ